MHKEIEKKLADERAMFRGLIDATPDIIFFKDTNSNYLWCNKACEKFLGIKEDELVGKDDYYIFDEQRAKTLREIDKNIIATGEGNRNTSKIILQDGKEVLVDTIKTPVYDHEGNISGIVGISRDVTMLQNTVDELSELNKKLEQRVSDEVAKNLEKNRMLLHQSKLAAMGEMMGAIAHQWRQPLNAIGIMIQDIKIAYHDGELSDEYIEQTVSSAMGQVMHMSNTIDDFRTLFKISKEKEIFVVKEMIVAAENLLDAQFDSNAIVINTKCHKPECDGCKSCMMSIMGHPNELKQVLLNLLTNSKDAILENRKVIGCEYIGKVDIELSIVEENGRNICSIVIRDNGGGIAEDVIDRVFEPYFTTKDQGDGTGIGLYMARSIIKTSLNGEIYVKNCPSGAEFTILLPMS